MGALQIDELPNNPSRRNQPSVFIPTADDWVAALDLWTAQANAVAEEINTNAINALASETAAASSATSSASSASISASNANFVGNYSALTGALNIPASVFHIGLFWQLLVNLADVTTSTPSAANSDWAEITPSTANILSGGGAISTTLVNHITDGNTYDLPLANSVGANTFIVIGLPEEFSAFTPLLQRSGSDLMRFSTGTEIDFIFDTKSRLFVTFISDGISEWSL